jgi:hypothetical protein
MGNPIEMLGEIPRALGIEPSRDPILGGYFEDPAARKHEQQFQQAQQQIQDYRPEAQAAQMQALKNLMSLVGPVNQQLERLYGPQATFDLDPATSPLYDDVTKSGGRTTGPPSAEEKAEASRNLGVRGPGQPITGSASYQPPADLIDAISGGRSPKREKK